ncbi:hypothetical protein RHGRI_030424 [Rhododendron griersonianum]|uniref:Protein FAR1-RELATED SEQUENCE n=1 Tax=Rhododendron griersonianum TaxID=479676 RepID=A0AAV6ISK9_9ERIC|nr:hypothetical protein RHGRI_030424 [Rhododendron griersonianum]
MEDTFSGEILEEEFVIEENSMDGFKDLEFSEKGNVQHIKSSSIMGPREPCIGLVFEEWDDAMSCYGAYAKRKGFSIRKNRTRRSLKDKSVIGVEFSCYREGFCRLSYHKKRKNSASRYETMIGCKAMMSIRRDDEKWVVICSCHKFEFVGILCRHILALFAKKSLASHLPEYYILRRWTINAKSHVANEISPTLMSQVTLQDGSKSSSTLTKHNLMIEVLKVVEEGQKSQKKHDHLALALQKLHCELLAMEEDDEIDIEDDLESSPPLEGGTQLLSNITFTLHDPPHVASRGRPKSLRQKHPKENHVGKKRKCSICKQPGHTRTTCHIQKQVGDNVGGTSSSPSVLTVSTNQNLHEADLDLHNRISMSQDPKCSTFMVLI